jgi:two-component system sensor histidine kinase RegB
MGFNKISTVTSSDEWHRVLFLRAVSLVGQIIAILIAIYYLELELPLIPLMGIISLLCVWSFFSFLSLKRSTKVSDLAFFIQLTIDVLELTAVLYLTGGATNPFAWFLLVPHSIASSVLARSYAWVMAVITSLAYTSIVFYYQPLFHLGHVLEMGTDGHFQEHIIGMWIGFVLSAFLMAYFVAGMADSLRRRNKLLTDMQQKMFRDERLVALGTLAAGAAHELGTPLATVDIVAHELKLEFDAPEDKSVSDKLTVIQNQIKRCKDALSSITQTATESRHDSGQALAVDVYLKNTLNQWRVSHLDAKLEEAYEGVEPVPMVISDFSLTRAIINILDNAVQASPYDVKFSAYWTQEALTIVIKDEGPGLTHTQLETLGEPVKSSKDSGLGIGMHLSKASIEHIGGSIGWQNRKTRGVVVTITIPLDI